jgi:hypothetical protein
MDSEIGLLTPLPTRYDRYGGIEVSLEGVLILLYSIQGFGILSDLLTMQQPNAP